MWFGWDQTIEESFKIFHNMFPNCTIFLWVLISLFIFLTSWWSKSFYRTYLLHRPVHRLAKTRRSQRLGRTCLLAPIPRALRNFRFHIFILSYFLDGESQSFFNLKERMKQKIQSNEIIIVKRSLKFYV